MNRQDKARKARIMCEVQRTIAADPAQVWALVADPMRVGEWAPYAVVGYMGTELPKTGQVVFLQTRGWRPGPRGRRVEVKNWDAGSRYRCEIQVENGGTPVLVEVGVTPEVTGSAIATRVVLAQQQEVPEGSARMLHWYLTRRLERRLDRIEKVLRA